MRRKAVVILPGYADHSIERAGLAPFGLSVDELDWNGDRAAMADGVRDAEIVFVRDVPLDASVIAAMERCRGIVRYGVGVDTIDLVAARSRGIVVTRVPNYGAEVEVADHTLALFLAVRRRIVSRDRDVRKGAWLVGQAEPIARIAGSTAGMIGFGRIGQAVAHRLRSFGVRRFLVHDPYLKPEGLPADATLVDLARLAQESDLVTLHAPATAENRHIIDAAFLARVKPGAILVNTGRGPLINEQDLAAALKDGRLLGAGIDVFETEPPLRSPLLAAPNVVLSDHAAWYSEATVENLQRGALEQAVQILETGTASERVN
ncbi:C-terminal binding protein [Tabrizicola sp. J26]|uniref:C-terminal binding protein n=1 Tax=Alitabrizicola rongguiensis TaxID=2909234 RepID=UPI001F26FB70|nr:C-terminal binding protein [Tabrizicola rongguiensis]MCF1711118.1 C-terminal binding protein [Tabrizicola rongguiensis]